MPALRALSSCVGKEISGLSYGNYGGAKITAHSNLLELLNAQEQQTYPGGTYRVAGPVRTGNLNTLPAFLVFTACVEKVLPPNYYGTEAERHGTPTPANPPEYPVYGPEFASLIEDNGLGVVICTDVVQNPLYPPPHMVRMWIWQVNNEAVKAWWEANSPGVLERRAAFEASSAAAKAVTEEAKRKRKEDYDAKLLATPLQPLNQPKTPGKGKGVPVLQGNAVGNIILDQVARGPMQGPEGP